MKLSKILLLVAVVMAIALTGCDDFNFYELLDGHILTVTNESALNLYVTVEDIDGTESMIPTETVDIRVFHGYNTVTFADADGGMSAYVIEGYFDDDESITITDANFTSVVVKVPTFDVSPASLSASMTARSVTISGTEDYEDFTAGMLMMGPVLRGFVTEIVGDIETEVQVDMPGGTTEPFTMEPDGSFTSADGNIAVSIGTDIVETILLDFTTFLGDFTIYKTATFDGDITQDTFQVNFTGHGYIKGPMGGGSVIVNAAVFNGKIAKTETEFVLFITDMIGNTVGDDSTVITNLDLSAISLTTVPDRMLFYYDGNTYQSLSDIKGEATEIDKILLSLGL